MIYGHWNEQKFKYLYPRDSKIIQMPYHQDSKIIQMPYAQTKAIKFLPCCHWPRASFPLDRGLLFD